MGGAAPGVVAAAVSQAVGVGVGVGNMSGLPGIDPEPPAPVGGTTMVDPAPPPAGGIWMTPPPSPAAPVPLPVALGGTVVPPPAGPGCGDFCVEQPNAAIVRTVVASAHARTVKGFRFELMGFLPRRSAPARHVVGFADRPPVTPELCDGINPLRKA
jgi:hypothetical protein